MKNFHITALTKMGITQDVRIAIMRWKKSGERIIKRKKEKSEKGIEKTIEIKSGVLIENFMRKIMKKENSIKKNITKKLLKKLVATLSTVKLSVRKNLFVEAHVKFAERLEKDLMAITLITQNLLKSFGFVKVVISAFIKDNHRERLSEKTPKGEATVRTSEETGREEIEASLPPQMWSVGNLAESNSKQCINNDLWVLNLRSTGI